MSCACRVSEDLSKLQRDYGSRGVELSGRGFGETLKTLPKALLIWLVIIILSPFLIIGTLVKGRNGNIKIDKVFRIRNVGDKQIIQDKGNTGREYEHQPAT